MGNRQDKTTLAHRSPEGSEVVLQRQNAEIDTPVLPPPEVIERLNACRPDLIDWIMEETSKEAEARRESTRKIDDAACKGFVRGQLFGLIIGIGGITGGSLVAIFSESPATGGTIATAAIVVLAVAFIGGKRNKQG